MEQYKAASAWTHAWQLQKTNRMTSKDKVRGPVNQSINQYVFQDFYKWNVTNWLKGEAHWLTDWLGEGEGGKG